MACKPRDMAAQHCHRSAAIPTGLLLPLKHRCRVCLICLARTHAKEKRTSAHPTQYLGCKKGKSLNIECELTCSWPAKWTRWWVSWVSRPNRGSTAPAKPPSSTPPLRPGDTGVSVWVYNAPSAACIGEPCAYVQCLDKAWRKQHTHKHTKVSVTHPSQTYSL